LNKTSHTPTSQKPRGSAPSNGRVIVSHDPFLSREAALDGNAAWIPESQVKSRSYTKSSAQVSWAVWSLNPSSNYEVRIIFDSAI